MLKTWSGLRGEATVILSNRFVRYTVVPWHDALMTRDERLAQARHCFNEIYGDMSSQWSIMLSESRYRQPVLAAAVSSQLLDGLRQAFQTARISLTSIQPYLTVAYRQFGRVMEKKNGAALCFGVVEPDGICAMHIEDSTLKVVWNRRVYDDWRQELRAMLLQTADGGEHVHDASLFVFSANGFQADLAENGLEFERLKLPAALGFSPSGDQGVTMAVVGLD